MASLDFVDKQSVSEAAVRLARRHFFQQCRVGLGAMALGSLMAEDRARAEPRNATEGVPYSATVSQSAPQPHFAPRAKSVIFLFMAGGPSQL